MMNQPIDSVDPNLLMKHEEETYEKIQ
jgi:hypothetical protein